jgi:Zn-dependent protease
VATGGRFALGMAKPVPVNFLNLRHPRRDAILVAAVGPAANLVLAWIFAVTFRLTGFGPFLSGVYFNLGLGMFNFIPIPPLDGSRVLTGLLPLGAARVFQSVEPFGFWIVLALYMSGILFALILPGMNLACRWLQVPGISF